jgi:hypothetical protein
VQSVPVGAPEDTGTGATPHRRAKDRPSADGQRCLRRLPAAARRCPRVSEHRFWRV